jgi:glycosyltransferase involved in cell wall biosynthesis
MSNLTIGFLRPISPKIQPLYHGVVSSKKYHLLHGQDCNLSTLDEYFGFIAKCDLLVIDKLHDYPLQVSGVVNDCLALGTIPVTYNNNNYWKFIARQLNIRQVSIENFCYVEQDLISPQYIKYYRDAVHKYLRVKEQENTEACIEIMKKSLNPLYISFHGKNSTGGFIDLYRIAINEFTNNDYYVRILGRRKSISIGIQKYLPSHYLKFASKLIPRHSSTLNLLLNRNNSVVLFVMPSIGDIILLILIKLALPQVHTLSIIHNSPNHISSTNKIKHLCASIFQTLFYRLSDCRLFFSKDIKNSWRPLKDSAIYPIPIIKIKPANQEINLNYIEPEKIRLAIVGRWLPYKSLHLLSSSLMHLPISSHISIVLAGEGYPECEIRLLKSICKEKEISLRINSNFIDLYEAENIIKLSDYVCFLYAKASQSGFMHLCKELNTPVICTKVGSLHENLKNGGIGFCIQPKDYLIARLIANLPGISKPPHYQINRNCLPRLANLKPKP